MYCLLRIQFKSYHVYAFILVHVMETCVEEEVQRHLPRTVSTNSELQIVSLI
jgi:hypothetical protein